jgi:Resolvase, N terminal domain
MNTTNMRTVRLVVDPVTGRERREREWVLRRTADREGKELVTADLSRVSTSATDLSDLLDWFFRFEARLVSATPGVDTVEQGGRLVASVIIDVPSWQRERLSERIAWMRAEGMTLDAIADQLNAEGAPTNGGETWWHAASVEAAIGECPKMDDR